MIPKSRNLTPRPLALAGALASLLVIPACGGGGGSSAPAAAPPVVAHAVQVGPAGAMTFSPAERTITAGQTVTWQWASSGHSVDSGSGCTTDSLFNSGLLDTGASFTHTFPAPGNYPYFCAPHCSMGMTGTITVDAPDTTVTVGPSGAMTFSPSTLTIRAGQTVTWQWASSGHTVDSGSACTTDHLFNSGTLATGATFTHTFTTAGTFPYFCTPHCGMGMTGTIIVNP